MQQGAGSLTQDSDLERLTLTQDSDLERLTLTQDSDLERLTLTQDSQSWVRVQTNSSYIARSNLPSHKAVSHPW